MSLRVEVICVGTELLTGKVNTHTSYLGPKLSEAGLFIAREQTVGDDPSMMRETFSQVFARSQIVLCAGGLGPTFDDITRDVWSAVLRRKLRPIKWIEDDIKKKFKARGLPMPPMNRRQSFVLEGAEVIPNLYGTAPGQIVAIKDKLLVLLPGPGRELYPMVEGTLIPRLKRLFPGRTLAHRSLLVYGLSESRVDEMIRPWVESRQAMLGCQIVHGILASQAIITVKFVVQGPSATRVETVANRLTKEVREILGEHIFGEGTDTLELVVGRRLKDQKKTLAVAESCTGGMISKLLTDIAGSSEYFVEGITTYSNASKARRLGVTTRTLEKYGAVSEQVAIEMAMGLRRSSRADYALSVTGIAGPDGGTSKKPVGLVFIAVASKQGVVSKKFQFRGERSYIRQRAALSALNLLRLILESD